MAKKRYIGVDLAGTIVINRAIYNSKPSNPTTLEEFENNNSLSRLLNFKNNTYKYMITELLDFVVNEIPEDISSVDSNYTSQDDYKKRYGENYKILARISLKEHLIKAYINAVLKYQDEAELFRAITIITSLAHDVGKIASIRAKYNEKEHGKTSAMWLIDFYLNNRHIQKSRIDTSIIKVCQNTLTLYHNLEVESDIYIDSLRAIDKITRESELKSLYLLDNA